MDFRRRYGDWALIVGASQGLGRAIAMETAKRGMNVAMVARRSGPLEEAANAVEASYGVSTRRIAADLADVDILDTLLVGLGGIDISFLVYNAAAEPEGLFLDQPLAAHVENIAVNVTTPTVLLHHFGQAMVGRGRGGIVLCSSLAANQGIYNYVSYGAAKAYEMILGEGLWDELRDQGVDACTLMIGSTYTPNFIAKQQGKDGLFAHSRTPAAVPAGVAVPQLPEEAAAELFRQIEREWQPLVYANPSDEARIRSQSGMSRVDLIKRMSKAMRSNFRAALD